MQLRVLLFEMLQPQNANKETTKTKMYEHIHEIEQNA